MDIHTLYCKLHSIAVKGVVNLVDAIPLIAATLHATEATTAYVSKDGTIVFNHVDIEHPLGVKIDLPLKSTIASYGTKFFHHLSDNGMIEIYPLGDEFEFRKKNLKNDKAAQKIAGKARELVALTSDEDASDGVILSNIADIMSIYDVPSSRVVYHREKGFLLPVLQETPLVFDCINKIFDRLGDPNVGFQDSNFPTVTCLIRKSTLTIAHSKTGSSMQLSVMTPTDRIAIVNELYYDRDIAPIEVLQGLPSDQLYYVFLHSGSDLDLYPEDFRKDLKQLLETSIDNNDGLGPEYYLLNCIELWRIALRKILECKIELDSNRSRNLFLSIANVFMKIGHRKPTIESMLNRLVPDSMLPKSARNRLTKNKAVHEVRERGLGPEGVDVRFVYKICLMYLIYQADLKQQSTGHETQPQSMTNAEVMNSAIADLLHTLSDEVKLKLLRCITDNNTADVDGTIQTFLDASSMSLEELAVFASVDLVTTAEPTKEEKIWRNVKECLDALDEDESEIFISLAFKACTFLKKKPMIVWNYMSGLRIYADCLDAQAVSGYLSGNKRLGNFLSSPSDGYVVTYDNRPITVKKSPTCSDSLLILV